MSIGCKPKAPKNSPENDSTACTEARWGSEQRGVNHTWECAKCDIETNALHRSLCGVPCTQRHREAPAEHRGDSRTNTHALYIGRYILCNIVHSMGEGRVQLRDDTKCGPNLLNTLDLQGGGGRLVSGSDPGIPPPTGCIPEPEKPGGVHGQQRLLVTPTGGGGLGRNLQCIPSTPRPCAAVTGARCFPKEGKELGWTRGLRGCCCAGLRAACQRLFLADANGTQHSTPWGVVAARGTRRVRMSCQLEDRPRMRSPGGQAVLGPAAASPFPETRVYPPPPWSKLRKSTELIRPLRLLWLRHSRSLHAAHTTTGMVS